MPKTTPDRKTWYDDGLSFECTQCGNCCSGPTGVVWFTHEEGKAMAAHLGMAHDEFLKQYTVLKWGKRSLQEITTPGTAPGKSYDCIFLTRDDQTGKAGCSIYPVRPTQCRTWPFWPSNLESRRAWDRASKTCPGMQNGGNFYPIEKIRIILNQNNDEV